MAWARQRVFREAWKEAVVRTDHAGNVAFKGRRYVLLSTKRGKPEGHQHLSQ